MYGQRMLAQDTAAQAPLLACCFVHSMMMQMMTILQDRRQAGQPTGRQASWLHHKAAHRLTQ
jgi:hypothetical protein